ncbi:type IV pilus assembly protein FimV, partial [Roseateles sp. GG27B]
MLRFYLSCMKNSPLARAAYRASLVGSLLGDPPNHRRFYRRNLPGAAMLSLLLAGVSAQAIELGRPQTLSGLGQPLLLKIPVRLDPGETLRSDCIQVAVQAGEHDIAP